MKATENLPSGAPGIVVVGSGNTIVICGDGCIVSCTENGQNNISGNTIGDGSCNTHAAIYGSILGSGDGNVLANAEKNPNSVCIACESMERVSTRGARPMDDLQKRDDLIDHLISLVEHLTAQIDGRR